MGRRKKVIKNLKIETVAAEGRGLGRHDGKVIFVDYGIPGDVADVRLTKNKKDYGQGLIQELIEPSPLRQQPFCKHFFECGGCRWQHVSYEQQLEFKAGMVEEAFVRTGKLSGYETLPILGSKKTTAYRNKFDFTFTNSVWFTAEQIASGEELERRGIGFHVAGRFQRVVHVEHCHLQEDEGNAIRLALFRFATEQDISFYHQREHKGLLRGLIMRYTSVGERMIIVCFGEDDEEAIGQVMQFLQTSYPDLTALHYVVNTKLNDTIYDLDVVVHAGKDHIIEQLGSVRYRIGPKSFFQTNSSQAGELYRVAAEFADLQPDELVYDLYTGIGSIALYLAHQCKHVIGIETVPEAIEDAKVNASLNDITNCTFIAGSAERILNAEFLQEQPKPDVIITDPPRAGMHKDAIAFLLMADPQRIVYISCNPVTQARDIGMLSERYELVKIQPVDMFPHTYHVENVALLVRRD